MHTLSIALGLSMALALGQTANAESTRHKLIENGPARISYSIQGSGPLVVIIGSLGRGTAELDPLAKRLVTHGYRVALPEARGIDMSSGPMQDITLHDLAGDYAALINAEGGSAIVAGHAYGQWVARMVAADHPKQIRGTVLIAAGSRNWPRFLLDEIATINSTETNREQKLASLRVGFFAAGNDPTPWLEGWHPEVTKSQLAAEKATRQESWWAGGSAPILDLQAAADPFRPAGTSLEMRNEFGPRVTIKIIPNASHALPAERPLETADAIAEWAGTLR